MKQYYGQVLLSPPKPFVKWAGGKRQLIPELTKHLPKKFDTYFEPFLGGGALLFHLLYKKPDLKCQVSD
ncbi:MAG: adenine methylase protein [Thaumarchaeota archaeon CSP1-1]|nr:MAG: adenine methylase protein [Thaumarchaeota archaeon CSP1-1]